MSSTSTSPTNQQIDGAGIGRLTIQGIDLRYRISGKGQVLLLLHGWGSSIDSFDVLFRSLSSFFTLVAFDFPGHGSSALPPTAWSVADFTDLTLLILDTLHIDRVVPVGHSFGGRVAITLAAQHPERVERLVLVDAAGVPSPMTMRKRLRRGLGKLGKLLRHFGPVGQPLRTWLVSRVASTDYLAAGPLLPTFLRVINEDLTPLLGKIACPTLLVWGDGDQDTPVTSGKVMERLINNAKLTILKNAGHYSYIDQFGRFRLALLRFLS